ncbi:MAG: ABC transporter permease subunit [Tissierellia bacterium]|jgi:glutathione transport system permease protein|nr:ABC transporter permease subunit [Tissierellia bacterium]
MFRYVLKRLLAVIPTLILISIFVFSFVRLIPGDPARRVAGVDATLEDIEMIRESLGLNKPVLDQYKDYMLGLLQGDLGTSLKTKRPVTYEIGLRYMNTVRLTLASLFWSVIIGILIGVVSGKNRSKIQDYAGMTFAVSGISIPSFWLGLILIQIFAVKLRWFPTIGAEHGWRSLVLPSLTLGASVAAIIARFTRSSIIGILKEDYVRTARAKGLKENKIIWKHVFRNSMIAVVTVVGLQFGFLLSGSVVTESVFAYPGLGSLLIDSVGFRDYPTLQSLILIFSLHFVLINLLVDLIYAALNPEIKLK